MRKSGLLFSTAGLRTITSNSSSRNRKWKDGMSIVPPWNVIVFGVLFVVAATPAAPQVPNAACPSGTLLFGYGDSAGCIKPGTNEVVVKCFRQKTCSPGWKPAGLPDDRGYDLCMR
jgi:hypothetical protein